VNVEIAGEEADLSWPQHMRIIEIDGPQYHRTSAEDARKQSVWEAEVTAVDSIESPEGFEASERNRGRACLQAPHFPPPA
jgi:very-short-patch-repair endonuclease